MDMTKLEAFMDKLITDFGGAALAANVMLGDEPGQYRAVADSEPVTPTQIAARTGCRRTMASSIIMAQAFPNSSFEGFDEHASSIETARQRAAEAGVADRVRFEVSTAEDDAGQGYDLVCSFDCLHDLGDPVGAARRATPGRR